MGTPPEPPESISTTRADTLSYYAPLRGAARASPLLYKRGFAPLSMARGGCLLAGAARSSGFRGAGTHHPGALHLPLLALLSPVR